MAARRAAVEAMQAGAETPQADDSHAFAPSVPLQTGAPAATPADIPADVTQHFLRAATDSTPEGCVVYHPALLGAGRLHFVRSTYHVDEWQQRWLLCPVAENEEDVLWERAKTLLQPPPLRAGPETDVKYAPVPAALTLRKNYDVWQKSLKGVLYRTMTVSLWHCPALKQYSQVGETEGDFRVRLTHKLHEQRDGDVQRLREKYARRVASLEERIARAREQVQRAQSQVWHENLETAIAVGKSVFGALFSRKKLSRTNVDRVSSTARQAGRASRQQQDAERAKERLGRLLRQRQELDEKIARDVARIEAAYGRDQVILRQLEVRPRKRDIAVDPVSVVWVPKRREA
jgi:hypothetical protein